MNLLSIKEAIVSQYQTETTDMIYIMIFSGVLFAGALFLWFRLGDRFSVSLAIVLTVIAAFLAASSVSLYMRDTKQLETIVSVLDGGEVAEQQQVVAAERDRIQTVVNNYATWRNAFAAIALLGAVLIIFTSGPVWKAVAVGCLLFGMYTVTIDHFSEERARLYLQELNANMN